MEASGNWMFVYETIEQYTPQVVLAHPLKTRAIAEARIKTDTIDATTLAELLRLDGIPQAYIPPREVRDVRELLRYRAALVSLRIGLKNKVHAVLTKNAMECSWSNVLGNKSQQWLKTLPLRPVGWLRSSCRSADGSDCRDYNDDQRTRCRQSSGSTADDDSGSELLFSAFDPIGNR